MSLASVLTLPLGRLVSPTAGSSASSALDFSWRLVGLGGKGWEHSGRAHLACLALGLAPRALRLAYCFVTLTSVLQLFPATKLALTNVFMGNWLTCDPQKVMVCAPPCCTRVTTVT